MIDFGLTLLTVYAMGSWVVCWSIVLILVVSGEKLSAANWLVIVPLWPIVVYECFPDFVECVKWCVNKSRRPGQFNIYEARAARAFGCAHG